MSKVLHTELHKSWFVALPLEWREEIVAQAIVANRLGPNGKRPLIGKITGSRHPKMKELCVEKLPSPIYRIFFVFDSEQNMILLVGGDKCPAGKYDEKFYERMVSLADEQLDLHEQGIQQRRAAAEQAEKKHEKSKNKNRSAKRSKT